jgi:hypothetical protein
MRSAQQSVSVMANRLCNRRPGQLANDFSALPEGVRHLGRPLQCYYDPRGRLVEMEVDSRTCQGNSEQ